MTKEQEIQAFLLFLQAETSAQPYLKKCYQKLNESDVERLSYNNSQKFIYYLKHGLLFYEDGKNLSEEIQPIIFFYGMTHLLKGVLLTKRPHYPESTKLLAHGVSTRKRKRKFYQFMKDEVKIQHHGLFPYLVEHVFPMKRLNHDKISMEHLLALIPEIQPYFNFIGEQKMIIVGQQHHALLSFPTIILDTYHMTKRAFIEKIKPYLPPIENIYMEDETFHISLKKTFKKIDGPFYHDENNIYFPIDRAYFLPMSEILIHYLILYNLSMVSRYEAEWWGDLINHRPNHDYVFITQFLKITAQKMPLLLGKILYDTFI